MELKGSLKERPVLELLSSMAREGSSGILSLLKGREGLQVQWSDGKILQVIENPVRKKGDFGQMMLDVGQITSNQLEQALGQQRRSLAPLGEILVKLFQCDPNKVLQVLRVQAIERLYAAFSWRSGQYTFEVKPVSAIANHFEPIDMEALVSEAAAVMEAWPKARKQFDSPALEVEAIGPSVPSDIELTPLEDKIFQLLTVEAYSVRSLSIGSGLGRCTTGVTLENLKKHQLIIVRTQQKQGLQIGRMVLGDTVLGFAVWSFVMAMLVGAMTYLLAFAPYSPLSLLRPYPRSHISTPGWGQTVDVWRSKKIRAGLELHRLHYGEYPKALRALCEKGWFSPEMLLSTAGTPFSYRRISKLRYRLLRPLP